MYYIFMKTMQFEVEFWVVYKCALTLLAKEAGKTFPFT